MVDNDKSADGTTFEGRSASAVGPGGAGSTEVAPPELSTPDADASEAVAAVLEETGADRAALEGPAAGVVVPTLEELDAAAKPADKPEDKPAKPDAADPPPDGDKKADKPPDDKPADPPPDAKPPDPPKPDDKPPTPALTAAEAAEKLNLTAEDLEAIEKDPEKKKIYKHFVKALSKNFEEVATLKRGQGEAVDMMAKIKASPADGLRALAAVIGVPITIGDAAAPPAAKPDDPPAPPPPKPPLELAQESLVAAGLNEEGAKVIGPAVVKIAEAVARNIIGKDLEPIRTQLTASQTAMQNTEKVQAAAKLQAAIVSYGRKVVERGDEWSPEIEQKMGLLVPKAPPGKGIEANDYFDILYAAVNRAEARVAQKTDLLARLTAATDADEPTNPVRPAPPVRASDQEITVEMSDEEATKLAIRQTVEAASR